MIQSVSEPIVERACARHVVGALIALVVTAACSAPAEPAPELRDRPRGRAPTAATETAEVPPLPPARTPAPARMVAIGDVHGDLDALRSALRVAGAIDGDDRWVGGALWIVQVGDVLDRGDDEDDILALITRLERDAADAGGRFVALLGNHELMNVQGDFRYVTPDGFADFESFAADAPPRARERIPREMLGRAAAFAPGGRYARELAARSTVVVVGDTVLVHGGLTARHAQRDLDALNRDVRQFFLGEAPLPAALRAEDSPVWDRSFAVDPTACAELEEVLARVGAQRMIVGHTVQRTGITSACDERVWRIDVGLSRHYGGPIEVLEIAEGRTRVLRGARGAVAPSPATGTATLCAESGLERLEDYALVATGRRYRVDVVRDGTGAWTPTPLPRMPHHHASRLALHDLEAHPGLASRDRAQLVVELVSRAVEQVPGRREWRAEYAARVLAVCPAPR